MRPTYNSAMTLRRKMGLQIAAMIFGSLIISATALWGLDSLHEDYGLAVAGYQELRQVYEVGSHLSTARILLLPGHSDRARARAEVEEAAGRFELLAGRNGPQGAGPQLIRDLDAEAAVRKALEETARQLQMPPEEQASGETLASDATAVTASIGKISIYASRIRETIEALQRSAQRKHEVTVRAVAGISAAGVIAAIVVGMLQYRGVMMPLSGLRGGVRRIASGHFAERLVPRGQDEFAELADEFNRMAGELDGFYHQLEQKVAQKSKELVRSERLASLGYLAAGVAHEINNPLGIITGYAEFSLEQLKGEKQIARGMPAKGSPQDDLVNSLTVICEEAFRCKDITGKLLSLARQGEESRQPVCLIHVAENVASLIGGFSAYRNRVPVVITPQGSQGSALQSEMTVMAVEAEMRQVILNLVLNALEASPRGSDPVRIELRRDGSSVELSVVDQGHGMSPQTLERVFEPFFTEKRRGEDARGAPAHGTGLGLSITHAIIQDHGGTIAAYSEGLEKGSRFVVRLPAIPSREARETS